MSNLSPVEFEQLKSLISGRTLSTGEQTITLDILRSKFSNFLSNLGLTEANLKDDKFLIKYFAESHNRNKIEAALKKERSLSPSQLIELIEALETKPVVTEEKGGGEVSGQGVSEQQAPPAGTATGTSGGMPGMPSGPSFSPAQRRIIHNIPPGGKEGGTGQGTAATNKINRLNQPPVDAISKEAAQPAKSITSNYPSRKREKKRWFGRLRSSGFSNPLDLLSKRFASWVWRNAIKPLAQWLGRNILQPALRWLGSQAGRLLFQLLPRLAMAALNSLAGLLGGLGAAVGGLAGLTFALGSLLSWLAVALVAFVAVTVLATFLSPFITPIKEPVQVNYTLPLRNPNVSPHPQPIQDTITQTLPAAHIGNWQTIIDAAVANNWNPALLLTLWIEASGAQEKVAPSLVCDRDPTKTESELDLNLRCFFRKFGVFKDNQFPDFIKDYAESNTTMTGDYQGYESYYNEAFLQRIKDWYTQMVPEEELGAIKPITSGEASGISGCPVTGIITNPYGYNLPDYPYKNIGCGSFDSCHNGIDIDAAIGTDIKAPMKGFTTRGQDDQRGKYIEIHESSQAFTLETVMIFDHLSEYAPKLGDSNEVAKGEVIGKTGVSGESTGPHLHYNIKKGNVPQNPFIYLLGSATINSDVLTSDAAISKNNYGKIRHEPDSNTNNWGTCNTSP